MQEERIEAPAGIPPADPCEALPAPSRPAIPGRVLEVLSGDTLRIRLKGLGDRRVRLAGLEAPPPATPLGKVARHRLGRGLKGELVWVVADSPLGASEIRACVEQLAEIQLAMGLGRFLEADAALLGPSAACRARRAEAQAKASRLGIWMIP